MNGQQAQGYMRGVGSTLPADDQAAMRDMTNDYRTIPSPNDVVDRYTGHCEGCDEYRRSRGVPVDATELERTYASMGGDIRALKQVQCFMDRHENSRFTSNYPRPGNKISIGDNCKFAVNEHAGRGTRGNKMFIVNRCTGEVKVMNVTRGSRGIGQGTGKTNPGFHLSAGWHHSPSGKNWSPGIKMIGLQRGVNDEALGRGVVMHYAKNGKGQHYCSGGQNSSNSNPRDVGGDCGHSNGCPAVQKENWSTVVNNLLGEPSQGNVIYNYTNREANKGDQYCGDRLRL